MPAHRLAPKKMEKVRRYLLDRRTRGWIGETLGVADQTIRRIAREMQEEGLTLLPPPSASRARHHKSEVMAEVLRLDAEGRNLSQIGATLGINRKTARGYLTAAGRRTPGQAKPLPVPVVDPVQSARVRTEQAAKNREYVDAIREHSFRSYLSQLVSDNVPPLPIVPVAKAPKSSKTVHLRHPLLTLTDWHFEERVAAEGVLGLNSYDIPTACRRVHRVIRACVDWKKDVELSGRFRIPTLTVALMGDFLTGTLHGLEKNSDAPNVVRAALACGDLLALALRDLAAAFPAVSIVGVAGNHGRLPDNKKVPTKEPTRSWDYLVYQVARRRLADQTNITWNLPEAYGVLFEVGNQLCYTAHGNFIPSSLGIAGYGLRRFASSLAANISASGRQLKYCFFGHWHQSNAAEFAGITAFICPSLIGTQEYSFLSGGSVNRSAQLLHIIDEKLGYVSQEILYGDGATPGGAYEIGV